MQLLHGRHAATTGHSWHSAHARHTAWHLRAAVATAAFALLALAVFALATLGLLLGSGATAHAAHAELAGHLGHHLLSLVEALNELVDLGNAYTRTISNALAARCIENLRILTLLRRHTANDRLDAVQLLFIHHGGHFIHLLAAGHHLQQVADGAHLADHQHLLKEVIERQLARAQLRGCLFGLLVV